MLLQLNPQLPVWCEKGEGYAFAMVDYSQEHPLYFVIALNDGGEIWVLPQHKIRMIKNETLGREIK